MPSFIGFSTYLSHYTKYSTIYDLTLPGVLSRDSYLFTSTLRLKHTAGKSETKEGGKCHRITKCYFAGVMNNINRYFKRTLCFSLNNICLIISCTTANRWVVNVF